MKTLCTLIVAAAVLVTVAAAAQGRRFPSSVPAGARQEIQAIESAVGFHPFRGTIDAAVYDEAALDKLVGTLVSGSHTEVRRRSAELIADVLGRFDVPAATVQTLVLPALKANLEAAETLRQSETGLRLIEAVERAAWQAEYRMLATDADRLRFLSESVYAVRGQDSYYYNFAAIDHLVETGGEKARKVIEAKLAESRQRSVPSDITQQLSAALIKLGTRTGDANARTAALAALVSDANDPVSRNVTLWAVRELGRMKDPAAADALRTIWHNETLDEMVRFEAQEGLVARGELRAIERTIAFQ